MARPRIVLDTNTLVSRLLLAHSVPAQAVREVVHEARLLVSEATMAELADLLVRPRMPQAPETTAPWRPRWMSGSGIGLAARRRWV